MEEVNLVQVHPRLVDVVENLFGLNNSIMESMSSNKNEDDEARAFFADYTTREVFFFKSLVTAFGEEEMITQQLTAMLWDPDEEVPDDVRSMYEIISGFRAFSEVVRRAATRAGWSV